MERRVQLRLRAAPVAIERAVADRWQRRDLVDRQAREETQLDQVGEARFVARELVKRAVEPQQLVGVEFRARDVAGLLEE